MTDEANELLELIVDYGQAYYNWDDSKYSSAELYEEICNAVEELDKKGQKIKKQQEKIFDLLKRNGWERISTSDNVSNCFMIKREKKDNATHDGFEALGWCEALEINNRKILMQKEDEHYVIYLKF